jgi:hypothetical protein
MPPQLVKSLKVRAQSLGITFTELVIRLASQPLQELELDLDWVEFSPLFLHPTLINSNQTAECENTSTKPLFQTKTNLEENTALSASAISQLELRLTNQLAQQQAQIAQLLAAVNRLQTSRPLAQAEKSSLTSATTVSSVNFQQLSTNTLQPSACSPHSPTMAKGSDDDTLDLNSAYAYAQAQGYSATLDAFFMLIQHSNPQVAYAQWNLSVDLERVDSLGQKTKWLRPLDRTHYYRLIKPSLARLD